MEASMKYLNTVVAVLTLAAACTLAQAQASGFSQKTEQNIAKSVRHQLAMLPYVGVFDNLEYRVDGDNVTLFGQVTNSELRQDAEHAANGVEGVARVDDKIEVLPTSIFDDQLRLAVARAIYGYAPLERYASDPQAPIRIIVKNGHVRLEGIVSSQMDRNLAFMRANGVPFIYSVVNDLRVAS
jgi:osmotically-inducible protein OsmY